LRIAARHAFDQGWVGHVFTLLHGGKEIPAVVQEDGQILTTIGRASYEPAQVPTNRKEELFNTFLANIDGKDWIGSSLTTGSTHTVIPVESLPNDAEIASLGPQFEHLPLFPDRTSVIFVKELTPMSLQIRIWERGVGETLGCGTGSSAAASDYLRRTGQGGQVKVLNPGGEIIISLSAFDQSISIVGVSYQTFSGFFCF
jgi:diaminopimelate epimerase